ncbi:DNA-binding protein [Rhodococcus opacus]|uniref:DNA-binding protein n=1 Tax=Rhodococcus opacus TaxID=37919 RepID=UPI0024B980BB|nr:DNA-binding protein [Rhodococcus opacus]MDJ0413828.1 DNA-binding protein [Rhodococcus opacus]
MTTIWTPEAVKGLGVITDLKTALSIHGVSQTTGYALAKRGELPFPVLRLGRKYVVPVAGILAALNIDTDESLPVA